MRAPAPGLRRAAEKNLKPENSQQPLRIVEIDTFGRGGLTPYAYHLSEALAELGHEVTLVTAAAYELDEATTAQSPVRVRRVIARVSARIGSALPGPLASLLRKLEAIADAFLVAVLTHRIRPDVVHLHSTNPIALLYTALFRALRPSLVVTAHVVTPHEPMRFERAIYGAIHRLADGIIVHTDFDRRRLLAEFGVAPERVSLVPLGNSGFLESGADASDREEPVDPQAARQWLGLDASARVALFFGYIREYKGLDLLLTAWPEIEATIPGARLVVAGDPVRLSPTRRDELERWAARVGAVHRFQYIPVSDVPRYFAAADVLVMPYRHISQSAVLFQALSAGVPVVATRVGGILETLRDGETAVLVAPESPAALAEGVARVLGDAACRTRLAAAGQRLAAAHSWAEIAARTAESFRALTGGDRETR